MQEQAVQQRNYAAGYAIGQGAGNIINAAMLRHRNNSWCKKHPGHDHGFHLENGQGIYCDEWNSGNHRFNAMPTLSELNQIQQAHALALQNMEEQRKDLNFAKTWSTPIGYEDAWLAERNIYCTANPGAKYIDLEGAEQACH